MSRTPLLVAVDLDDVLNDITGEMCKSFGCGRITLDDILKGNVPEGFNEHRKMFLGLRSTWELPPTEFALQMMDYLQQRKDTKVIILTKTPSREGSEGIAAIKCAFKNKYFPNIDMFIVNGDKSFFASDVLIDDLQGNCQAHKSKHNSEVLVYRQGITTLDQVERVCDSAKKKLKKIIKV